MEILSLLTIRSQPMGPSFGEPGHVDERVAVVDKEAAGKLYKGAGEEEENGG
jgi:hypothetical protein